jgi:uncharacterized membrane protein YeaQ/YmgE (transglycosylase-associated protein family)
MRTVFEQGIIPDLMFGVGIALFSGTVYNVSFAQGAPGTFQFVSLVFAFAGATFALGVLRMLRKPLNTATA